MYVLGYEYARAGTERAGTSTLHGLFSKRRWRRLGPQRPGRVAQPHAGRPSCPRTDGHDCAASHGHWRFSRATCLHRLPRRYTRLIVLLKGGNSDYQDVGLEVDDDDPTVG